MAVGSLFSGPTRPSANSVSTLSPFPRDTLPYSEWLDRWFEQLLTYFPDERGFIEFMVKHYPGGKQSTHLHSLKPGDKVTFASIKV